MINLLKFADSESSYEESEFVIFGVPFDITTSFRGGARFAPNSIREASINLESFLIDPEFYFRDAKIHDMGNLYESGNVKDMIEEVGSIFSQIINDGKFPIMLGGEHSVTIGTLSTLKKIGATMIFIDAHSDFRDSYLNEKFSHACVARRSFEELGKERVLSVGIRSVSPEEFNDPEFKNFRHYTSFQVRELGIKKVIDYIEKIEGYIYLSIDMDGIDPAYAPAVATPEPYGLTPWDVREIIFSIGEKLVGADVVEIVPHYDNGNTSMLGAKFVQEIIASKKIKSHR